jgi:hypothetical protein
VAPGKEMGVIVAIAFHPETAGIHGSLTKLDLPVALPS